MNDELFTHTGKQIIGGSASVHPGHVADAKLDTVAAEITGLLNLFYLMGKVLADEGATVEFTGGNPDFNGQPDHIVTVCADFTGWVHRSYADNTRVDCLLSAVRDKEAFDAAN